MKYLPYQNYSLSTKLSIEEIIKRFSEHIQPVNTRRFALFSHAGNKAFEGRIDNKKFDIVKIPASGNISGFSPIIKGTFEVYPTSTRIHIKVRLHVTAYIFLICAFGMITFAGIAILIDQLNSGTFSPATLFIFVMYGFFYLISTPDFLKSSKETKKFFCELLEAHELIDE